MDLKEAADKVMDMYEKLRQGLCLPLLQPACTYHDVNLHAPITQSRLLD